MKLKTSELIGPALDWAVAKCESTPVAKHSTGRMYLVDTPWGDKSRVKWIAEYGPSRHWAQGGPIIEREHIAVWWDGIWHSKYDGCRPDQVQDALTPLIAAMRCFVASKLGDEVDVPEELP